ncbi:MAG: sigma-70 family RNA polymerase sigma factor [Alphaproteobacteria bacterium]|nr:sigma-70 family RNA polymerase sigma factor [Alphaproteobacteria bacterium]
MTGTATALDHLRRAVEGTGPDADAGARLTRALEHHERAVRRLALDLLGEPALADAVTRSTLEEVYAHLPTLADRDAGRVGPRVFRVAVRHAFDAVRIHDELLVVDGVLAPRSPEVQALRELCQQERRSLLFASIGGLDPPARATVRLRYLERLPHRTIDAWLGSEGSREVLEEAKTSLTTRLTRRLATVGRPTRTLRETQLFL